MPTNPRNLIIFEKKASESDFHQILTEYNWKPFVVHEVCHAEELLNEHQFLIGLCLVDYCNDDVFCEELKKLFNMTSYIVWVMGLPVDCFEDKSSCSRVLELIAQYCHDYLILPVSKERLLFSLGHALGMAEIRFSPFRDINKFPNYYGIIGNSPPMLKLFKRIDKVRMENCAVLTGGETGTGKELVAKAIHKHSDRAEKPFVAVNCGSFPNDLIHAELFGYEKGAFTGAQNRKIGRIESADGGILFLDEIGDLPLPQQVNLLRFLEEKAIVRIGGTAKIPVDVRILSATHVDLKKAVESGKFREDLYYRLRVVQLEVPQLRDRENDIELLAWYFFKKYSEKTRRKPKGFSAEAMYLLKHHYWPGNVRELMNCIRHAVIMSENRLLTAADLGLEKRQKDRFSQIKTLEQARSDAERESIMNSIRIARYNMTLAAKQLGISRITLYRLIEKYQLNVNS